MLLSSDYTGVRVAVLTGDVIDKLLSKYNYPKFYLDSGHMNTVSRGDVIELNELAEDNMPGKGDLITEWVLSSLARGSGRYPEDFPLFINNANFFFTHYKNPRFKKVVKESEGELGKSFNPKNILDFTLHDLYVIEENYKQEDVDPKVLQLESKLPDGSRLLYNNGSYQVIEVTSSGAACQLARGTKWCTSDKETASNYLNTSPLYILYQSGKKFAQLHIGSYASSIQFMDLRDRPIEVSSEIRKILIDSGLMDEILQLIGSEGDVAEFVKFTGREDTPYLREKCLTLPLLSYMFAEFILRGKRFYEGEKVIALNPNLAIKYAYNIIRGRFREAEPSIFKWGEGNLYKRMIKTVNLPEWGELVQEYPSEK